MSGLEEIDIGRQHRNGPGLGSTSTSAVGYQESGSAYSYDNIVLTDLAASLREYIKENQFYQRY